MLHPSLWLFYHRTDVFATFVNRSVIVHYPGKFGDLVFSGIAVSAAILKAVLLEPT